ncbi:DEAD/DEAH box helicase [Arthrobacter koreensis]|uniref:DEAD/DEAH box helicase n=1 Tax=Arthrobacter koreensis TaxID=199136 RepID=UPI003D8CB3F0
MRSALNPELLHEALGLHPTGPLPTVEELTALIAEVEVAGFQGNYKLDDKLVTTAWYLHGVASASEATELYTAQRQQRAFRVSAHIFDLALNDDELDIHDRLTMAFAAQVGYRRSKLDPNATSIYRRAVHLLDDTPVMPESSVVTRQDGIPAAQTAEPRDVTYPYGEIVSQIPLLALRIGVAFLGFDAPSIARLNKRWRRQFDMLADVLEVWSLKGTMYGPTYELLRAVHEMMRFMRGGDEARLAVAESALISVLDLTAGEGDHDARWVAAHLFSITDGLRNSSVWSVLPPGMPPAVAQAFTVSHPAVLTLWPPQQELLARREGNPLSPQTKRLLLSVPTSAGKTLMAQLMICSHLATENDSVCYVTPLRSLGREMRQSLRSRLRILKRELGADLPDRPSGFDDLTLVDQADVDVMTPERLMHALRHDPAGTLERYSLFVIDEVQLLAQPGRGFLLEALLTFLHATEARLILLSGVLGNAANLAQWLSGDSPEVLFTSSWRGPRQVHALLYSTLDWDAQTRTLRRSAEYPFRVTVPAKARLMIRPAESIVRSLETPHIGSKVFKATQSMELVKEAGTPFYADVAVAASSLVAAGSLLMVVSQRNIARSAAEVIAQQLDPASGVGELETFFKERLGAQHPLLECVRHGVGYHHAGLPTDVLNALEQALRDGQLQALVATSTLTDGVNLPVRTVVICETTYHGQSSSAKFDPARLLNAVGRAGRAGRETEGWIVLALNKKMSTPDFDKLTPTDSDLELESTLLDEESINSLARTEDLLRETEDAIFKLDPGPAADFVSYVWFVLSSLEQVSDVLASTDLPLAIHNLLGMRQLNSDLKQRWTTLAHETRRQFIATDDDSRRRWNSAGTTLATAVAIDQIVKDVKSALHSAELDPWTILENDTELSLAQTLQILSSCNVFARLLALPEANDVWRFRPTRNSRLPADSVNVDAVLLQWVGGAGISTLAETHLTQVPDVVARVEQMVDVVSGAFEHFLSWTVGVVIEQTNAAMVAENSWIRLRSSTSSMLRYGVDTSQALALLTGGVQSRRLAQRIGRWAEENRLEPSGLSEELANLHIDGWRETFEASPPDVLDLLEFTRTRSHSLLRELLESGTASIGVHRLDQDVHLTELSLEVSLRPSGEVPAAYRVLCEEVALATVKASDHTAVQDVLDSGLETTLSLVGSTLHFTVNGEG